MPVELRLLGGASLLTADGQLVSGNAAQPRRTAVLAVLAEAWPAAVSRDRLVGLIWPDQHDAGARRLLTQSLYELRRELGDITRSASRDIAVDADALRVDLIEFRRAVESGELERAIALHRGPFLDGFHLRGAPDFEQWATSVRAQTQRELERALHAIVARHEESGEWSGGARWAEELVHASPFDADAVARFMRLSERAGDPAAALDAAAMYERRMRVELELEPDGSVRRRAEEIRAAAERPAGNSAEDELRMAEARPPMPTVAEQPIAFIEESTAPAAQGEGPRRRHGFAWAIIAAGVVVALALAGAVSRTRSSSTGARTVTLQPFEVHGDGAPADLVPAVSSMLGTSLGGADGVMVQAPDLTPGRDRTAWGSIGGVIVVTGSQLRIDAELRTVENGVRHASVTGTRGSLIALTERLALELLPGFYVGLGRVPGPDEVRGFQRVEVLRRYLDGERALQAGAFEDAYDAFRRVTEQDSSLAYAWYRRAVAAEGAHRIADADRSAAAAASGAASLRPRERQLVRAYAAWRGGEIARADSLYRRLVETQANDAEAWFHFAEVAYHGGPLVGRPLDAARDAWRQAVALDSASFPALMHAVRLEARARNATGVEQLLRRAAAVGAGEPFASEARVIGAFGLGTAGRGPWNDLLDAMPDASVHFVHSIVAGFLEQPSLAEGVARRLTRPARPDAVRADGHVALAHVALARGAWRLAMAELDSAERFNPAAATWWKAYFVTLPFATPRDSAIGASSRQLSAATTRAGAAPLYLELAVDARAAPVIQRYNAALLRLASEPERADVSLTCRDAAAPSVNDLCVDLQHGVVADALRRAGRPAQALRELEAMSMRVPYQLAGRSAYFARTRERFLRADLLERTGRLNEAYDWYSATPHGGRLDYIFLAPSHLGRGRIRERQGSSAAAALHYRAVLALMPAPDPELAALSREAEAGLARLTNR
jgi:DNA-binding SARP family transcriptional activator